MVSMEKTDILYFALPLVLWPMVFLVFSNSFVYAMGIAAAALAIFTLWRHRKLVAWKRGGAAKILAWGILGAVILYLVFLAGYYLAIFTGTVAYVHLIYSLIYSQASTIIIVILLALIGVCEEIYWRGGVQGYVEKHSKRFRKAPWVVSTAFYSLVHIATLNPILVLAAFFVGLVTSLLERKHGIAASAMAHVLWIEAIIVFLPVITIH